VCRNRDESRTRCVTPGANGNKFVSRICGAMAQPNLIVRRAALAVLAIAGSVLTTACGDRHAKQAASTSTETRGGDTRTDVPTPSGPAWTAAKAIRQVRRLTLFVDGRRTKIDPTTVVCWGVGRPQRRGDARVWHRFDCIAPTFLGAHAGPDALFALQPTGDSTSRILNARFSSYEPSATG
jgi:hypothetical protein